ncbi:gamma-glutamyl kinase [Jannaschia sp. S6380]|uniref:gamma-glutamyl kinase n=1 Tax=Jannaschia sp. S6380 TaxID=2926408 RepID=UPI001FF63941|nr:gamma-glutamyl kinase [Jannaschia sp. S6380]MCK0166355.1 gamma-glutamyl kinase [Jannaschia sp. S6380]
MLVFWKHHFVLFAVPKTGTTAVEKAVGHMADAAIVNPPGMKHCTVAKYDRELRAFFEQKGRRPLQKVAVMREPISWLSSWFRYRSRPALSGQATSTAGVDFDAFVDAYLAPEPPPFARVGSQASFLAGGVDHLFRHEDPNGLRQFLEERLRAEIDLPRLNVSPMRDALLSPRVLESLRRERAKDFDLWEAIGGRSH